MTQAGCFKDCIKMADQDSV